MPKGRRPAATLRHYLDYYIDVDNAIATAFRDNMVEEILTNPEGCTLPLNMGFMKVIGNRDRPKENPQGHLAVNGKYDKDGKKIRYNNYHTDGKTFKVEWYSTVIGNTEDILKKSFRNSDIYVYKSAQPVRRALFDKITKTDLWTKYHMKGFFKAAKKYLTRGRPKKDGSSKVAERENTEEND